MCEREKKNTSINRSIQQSYPWLHVFNTVESLNILVPLITSIDLRISQFNKGLKTTKWNKTNLKV